MEKIIILLIVLLISALALGGCKNLAEESENYNYVLEPEITNFEEYILMNVSLDGNKGYEFSAAMNLDWKVIDMVMGEKPTEIDQVTEFGKFQLYDEQSNLTADITFSTFTVNKDVLVSDYAEAFYRLNFAKIGMNAIMINSTIEDEYAIFLIKYEYDGEILISRLGILNYGEKTIGDLREDIIIIGTGNPTNFEEDVSEESFLAMTTFEFI